MIGKAVYSNANRAADEAQFQKFTDGFKADFERMSAQLEWLKEHRADEVCACSAVLVLYRVQG